MSSEHNEQVLSEKKYFLNIFEDNQLKIANKYEIDSNRTPMFSTFL